MFLIQVMLQECLMSDCQRKFSMENFRKESALKVAKNTTKSHLKLHLSGIVSSTKELHSLKQSESVKQEESVKNGKQVQRNHHQTHHSKC